MKVLLVAPNASVRMGGEAILPLHWLRELNALGISAALLTHARCRDEIEASSYRQFPVTYVEDSWLERRIWWVTQRLPGAMQRLGKFALTLVTMLRLGATVRAMVAKDPVDVIHQIHPVSPRLASAITHRSIPVVIGPLNGNMTYPPGFAAHYGGGSEKVESALRGLSSLVHFLLRGKLKAALVLVANERTAAGLPWQIKRSKVRVLVENGVDFRDWSDVAEMPDGPVRFIYVGRLVALKAVDVLLEALAELGAAHSLTICGDGPEMPRLKQQAFELGIHNQVEFLGQVSQPEVREQLKTHHALVLPSVYECGGAVVLEAMAVGRAVIATDWGGPADYVTEETGVLVPPRFSSFSRDLAAAMKRLADQPDKIREMGLAGRQRVETEFAWSHKAEQMVGIYEDMLSG